MARNTDAGSLQYRRPHVSLTTRGLNVDTGKRSGSQDSVSSTLLRQRRYAPEGLSENLEALELQDRSEREEESSSPLIYDQTERHLDTRLARAPFHALEPAGVPSRNDGDPEEEGGTEIILSRGRSSAEPSPSAWEPTDVQLKSGRKGKTAARPCAEEKSFPWHTYNSLKDILEYADAQRAAFKHHEVDWERLPERFSRAASRMDWLKELEGTTGSDEKTVKSCREIAKALRERYSALTFGKKAYSDQDFRQDYEMWKRLTESLDEWCKTLEAQIDSLPRSDAEGPPTTHNFSKQSASRPLQRVPSAAQQESRRPQSRSKLQRQPDGSLQGTWNGRSLTISKRTD